jgi:prolyl oligopeptidase
VHPRHPTPGTRHLALLLLTAPLGAQAPAGGPLRYPPAHRDSVVEVHFGRSVPDPYRWLEQVDSPATADWVRAERALTEDYLARAGGGARAAIRRRLAALWSTRHTDVPWREAGRVFFLESAGDAPQPALYEATGSGDSARVVLDPGTISADGSIAVDDYAVSPDGRWLAYSRAAGGGDLAETWVRDLSTGRDLDEVVRGTRGTACWTFDGGGFFYWAPVDTTGIEKRVYYHTLGQPQERDRAIRSWPDARWLYCMLSDEGRWAFVVAERGSGSQMERMDLGDPLRPDLAAPLVPLLAGREARYTPMGTAGDTLYVFTDLDAPRGRVIALDLREGARAAPRGIVAEGRDVLQWATVAGDRLAVHYLVDVTSRLRLFGLDGRPAGEVALPGVGALSWPVNGRHSAPEVLYAFASFLSPETVYRYDLREGRATAFRAPSVPFDASPYETRQLFYRSKDGTRVPLFLTARRGWRADGSHPVLLTAYGANGLIEAPQFRPDVALWLELGGAYAVANVRGGGEYGEAWHRAGSLERKQRSFDDFIAAAQYLVDRRLTTPARLAITGHSSGGLLIGAVMTQRPDLFGVALPDAGHYDMLRYHRFTVGAGWIPEYGSPEDSVAFSYLAAYSPLQRVRPGTCYPATLLLAADHDYVVVPSHAYKFAAALQAAQACARPVLLRVATNASHMYASTPEAVAERADVWAFVAEQFRIPIPATW